MSDAAITRGPFLFEPAMRGLTYDNVTHHPPPQIFDALYYLAEQPRRMRNFHDIAHQIGAKDGWSDQTARSIVTRVRRWCEKNGIPAPVKTIWDGGYLWDERFV